MAVIAEDEAADNEDTENLSAVYSGRSRKIINAEKRWNPRKILRRYSRYFDTLSWKTDFDTLVIFWFESGRAWKWKQKKHEKKREWENILIQIWACMKMETEKT